MHKALATLINRLDDHLLEETRVIGWSSPVPSFGRLETAQLATVGLNPSNREFVDAAGDELEGSLRRFHTLRSLGLRSWAEADASHLRVIEETCNGYFQGNPYGRWFDVLERVISGSGASYYGVGIGACHLDLIPYATACKWTELSAKERNVLLNVAGDSLGLILEQSSISMLILNGRSVVSHFEQVTGQRLQVSEMPAWQLPRTSGRPVSGEAYHGVIDSICGYRLDRQVAVLGFNHNLQSSFGVTSAVISAIRDWISSEADRAPWR